MEDTKEVTGSLLRNVETYCQVASYTEQEKRFECNKPYTHFNTRNMMTEDEKTIDIKYICVPAGTL